MPAEYLGKTIGDKESVTERRQTLPEYLRRLRISCNYRQSFVASKLGISRQTYSHYETGRIRPPAGALYGIARLYGISVDNLLSRMVFGLYGMDAQEDWIRDNQENTKWKYRTEMKDSNDMERQLLSSFRCLSKRGQEDILSVIEMKIRNESKKENQSAECKVTV